MVHKGLKQGFSNGVFGPPWGPRSGSLGATSKGLYWVALQMLLPVLQNPRYDIKHLPVKLKFVVFIITS